MNLDISLNIINNIANDKFKDILNGKEKMVEKGTKLEEFNEMYNRLVRNDNKPTKLSAKEMLEKFDMENIGNKDIAIGDELIKFIEVEIEKQKAQKVDVLTNEEFEKIFNTAMKNEKQLLDEMRAIESLSNVMEEIDELLLGSNNDEIKQISDKLNAFIYSSGEMDGMGMKSTASSAREEIFEGLMDLYEGKSKSIDVNTIERIEEMVKQLKEKNSFENEEMAKMNEINNSVGGVGKKQLRP